MLKFSVEIQGLTEVVDHLKTDRLLAGVWADTMESIGQLLQHAGAEAAPIGKTGRTRGLMFHKVQSKPIPLWVRVGTTAAAEAPAGQRLFAKTFGLKGARRGSILTRKRAGKRGSWSYPFPYPRRLEYDPNSRYYGWFTNAIAAAMSGVNGVLDNAARRIEENWSK